MVMWRILTISPQWALYFLRILVAMKMADCSSAKKELTVLEQMLDGVKNYNIAVKKRGDDITFLRRIVPGGADDSYGIEVAKLAGIPNDVVKRAKEVLLSLTNGTLLPSAPKTISENKESDNYGQLDLYSTAPTNEALLALKALDVETLTPIEALNKLYELKKLAE